MREAFRAAAQAFRRASIETPELDARLLLCHAAGLSHEALIAEGNAPIGDDAAERFRSYVARRLDGEPVSRIRGTRAFYGRDFVIDAHTLDPRPDTETLIDAALDLLAREGKRHLPFQLLDLGTGSGCLLLSLLAELPQAYGVGTDISAGALRVAGKNARRLGLASRARFLAADWFDGLGARFDLIVSNPPYIPSGEIDGLAREVVCHDPRPALDGGADGLDAYRKIAASAAAFLKPGGHLVVEIGADQAEAVLGLFAAAGLALPEEAVRLDLAGRPRAVLTAGPVFGGTERRRCAKMRLENRDVRARFVSAK